MQKYIRQVLLLFCVSAVFTGFQLFFRGTNIVTNTYQLASERLANGDSPYRPPIEGTDQYKYSPLFAWLYAPLAGLGSHWQALIWGLFNAAVFWAGISLWIHLGKQTSWPLWSAVILASMELDGSLRYQQINALLTGMVLIGAYLFTKHRTVLAAFVLAAITNVKILPGLVAAALIFPRSLRFGLAFALFSAFFLALPGLYVGAKFAVALTLDWITLLRSDASGGGLFDIATVCANFGFPRFGSALRTTVAIVSILALGVLRWRGERIQRVLSIALLCLLLVSPRTESPTFVLLSPVYIFIAEELLPLRSRWLWGVYAICAVLITLSFNDVWPQRLLPIGFLSYNRKTAGVLFLWVLCLGLYFKSERLKQRRPV